MENYLIILKKTDFLISKGHTFRTHYDTEIIVHLWEEYGEEMIVAT